MSTICLLIWWGVGSKGVDVVFAFLTDTSIKIDNTAASYKGPLCVLVQQEREHV